MRLVDLRDGMVVVGLRPTPVTLTIVHPRADHTVFVCFESDGSHFSATVTEEQASKLEAPLHLNPPRPKKVLIVDGRLTVPLYHGTNALFLPSIREHGLGGRNIIAELDVIELLGELVSLCDEHLPRDSEWLFRIDSARRMARQHVAANGWNFRHGSTYLSASRTQAMGYGGRKEFGSEAIEYCMMLYRRVEQADAALLANLTIDPAPLVKFVSGKPKTPLLLEVSRIPVKLLRTEHGEPPDAELARLDALINSYAPNLEVMGQNCNFEMTGVLSEGVTAYEIKNDGGKLTTRLEPFD